MAIDGSETAVAVTGGGLAVLEVQPATASALHRKNARIR